MLRTEELEELCSVQVTYKFKNRKMAPTQENRHEASQECSICFQNILAAKSTLVCRHVLCQDCLSKILVVAQTEGSIVCPLCRHPTNSDEQKEDGENLAADEGHTQEAPLLLPMGCFQLALHTSTGDVCHGGDWVSPHLREISQQGAEQTFTASGSHISTGNRQGRQTTDDSTTVNITEDRAPGCTTYQLICGGLFCLVVLIFYLTMAWMFSRLLERSPDLMFFVAPL